MTEFKELLIGIAMGVLGTMLVIGDWGCPG